MCRTHATHKTVEFVVGSQSYHINSLIKHDESIFHNNALTAKKDSVTALKKYEEALYETEKETIKLMKVSYFIAKENLAFIKYPSLLKLLKDLDFHIYQTQYTSVDMFKEFLGQCSIQ